MTSETVQRRSKRGKKMKCISVLTIQSKTHSFSQLSFDPELYLVQILEFANAKVYPKVYSFI